MWTVLRAGVAKVKLPTTLLAATVVLLLCADAPKQASTTNISTKYTSGLTTTTTTQITTSESTVMKANRGLQLDLLIIAGVYFTFAIVLFCLWICWRNDNSHDGHFLISNKAGFRKLYGLSRPRVGIWTTADREKEKQVLYEKGMTLFKLRLEQYRKNQDSLNGNLFNTLFFSASIVAAILVDHQNTYQLPVLGFSIQPYWFLIAAPFCLIYLWCRFGFLFNEIINDRMYLWNVADLFEANHPVRDNKFAVPKNKLRKWKRLRNARYTYSVRTAIYDGLYLDGWFAVFRWRRYFIKVPGANFVSLFIVAWGAMIGLSHACMLGGIWICWERFPNACPIWVYQGCFWLLASVLFVTHYAFFFTAKHPNWMQSVAFIVLGGASIGTYCYFFK